MQNPLKFWNRSLMARLVSYFLLVSLLSVCLVGYVTYVRATETLKKSIFDRLQAVATLKEDVLNHWVDEQRRNAVFVAWLPEVQVQAGSLLGGSKTDRSYQAAYALLTEYLRFLVTSTSDSEELFIIDLNGNIVLSTNKAHEGQSQAGTRHFIHGKSRVTQNIYTSPLNGKPTITIATPLFNKRQRRVGVLASHLNLARIDRIILERKGLGESGETYLVNTSNVLVAAEARLDGKEFPEGVRSRGIDTALQQKDGSGLYLNYAGIPVIGVYRWVDDQNVALLVEMSQAEAFSPARQLAWTILLIGSVSAGLLTIGVYLLARQIARPILAITDTATRVAAGDLNQTAPVLAQDEVGVLARAFNQMTGQLRLLYEGLNDKVAELNQAQDELQAYKEHLEEQVEERTAALTRSNELLQQEIAERRQAQAERESLLMVERAQARQKDALLGLSEELAVTRSEAEVSQRIVNGLHETLGYDFLAVFLVEEETGDRVLIASHGSTEPMKRIRPGEGLTERPLLDGKLHYTPDVTKDSRYLHWLGGAEVDLPIRIGGEVSGVLSAESRQPHSFQTDDFDVLTAAARQAGLAIENVRLFQALQTRTRELARSVEELKALGEVSQAVNSTIDLQTVLVSIVAHAAQLSETEGGAIYEFDETTEEFQLSATHRMSEELIQAIRSTRIRLGETVVGQAGANREAVQIPDVLQASNAIAGNVLKQSGFRAVLAVPLLREEKLVGALVVRRRTPGRFKKETVELLQNFGTQSALAIQNARLFREIEEKGHELETASKHKSEFLANMSHELRTPLNAILGYTELILDNIYGDVPEKIREILERLEQNGRHLLGLINNVLDLTKIEAGQLTLALNEYSIKEIVQTVSATLESLAAEKDLSLTVSVAPDLSQGKGDGQRIAQVFMNLVGNAIKFTESGEIRVEVNASNGNFVVSVSDTGPGLSETDRRKIFEEFHQADTSSTREKGGTGLGLSIAKRIIEMHGGRIWVESAPESGSTFWFKLPVRVERQKWQV